LPPVPARAAGVSGGAHALEFGTGLIEGFYGRAWSDADRLATIDFLADAGYRYHVYAPKSAPVLRRAWRARWAPRPERDMGQLAVHARSRGIEHGVGLSPLGLVESLDAAALRELREKVRYLAGIGARVLCILFDDMPRGVEDLAERQADIVGEAIAAADFRHL